MTKAVCLLTKSKSLTNSQIFFLFKHRSSARGHVCVFCEYINVTLQFKWSGEPVIVIFTFGAVESTDNSSRGHLPKKMLDFSVLTLRRLMSYIYIYIWSTHS